jgi:putative lipoprotein (rSAM/lipoprotein system)
MKEFNRFFLRHFNAILVVLLGVFGFSSCNSNLEDEGGLLMYGTPTANFKIKGTVVDETNKQPIEGIQVKIISTFTDNNDKEHIVFETENITNTKGNFEFIIPKIDGLPLSAHISDIDGEKNGLFEDKIIEIDLKDAEKTKPGDNSWFIGEFTKTLNVELTPKAEETDE